MQALSADKIGMERLNAMVRHSQDKVMTIKSIKKRQAENENEK